MITCLLEPTSSSEGFDELDFLDTLNEQRTREELIDLGLLQPHPFDNICSQPIETNKRRITSNFPSEVYSKFKKSG